jgi:cobalt-zinc-cadmium efflux system outer membrane protein
LAIVHAAGAQQVADTLRPVSRTQAVSEALTNGSRVAFALTDTAAARAALMAAEAYPNPALAAGYSKSVPQYHVSLDQPIEYPGLRDARSEAAHELQRAAHYRFALERAAARVEADTSYTAALATAAHARLSARNAAEADSLLVLARLRRDAGDASELDVELASVNAGQAANASANDSLAALSALLELQRVMGLPAGRELIVLTDSLTAVVMPRAGGPPDSAVAAPPLAVAAAEASMRGAASALAVENKSIFSTPSLSLGFDTHDPTGAEPGFLPTIGITVPLPLWSRRSGEIAVAQAGVFRAQAEFARAQRESQAAIARARRELEAAVARVARDQRLLASADRVARMSLTAYAEGAAGIPTVLEAQRTARDALGHYVDDLAAAQNAAALLTLQTLTADQP